MDYSAVLSFGSFVVLGAVVYMLGQNVKNHVRATWSGVPLRLFNRTVALHPPFVCLVAYQVPGFPVPDGYDTQAGRFLLGLACGITTAWSYKAFRKAMGAGEADA